MMMMMMMSAAQYSEWQQGCIVMFENNTDMPTLEHIFRERRLRWAVMCGECRTSH